MFIDIEHIDIERFNIIGAPSTCSVRSGGLQVYEPDILRGAGSEPWWQNLTLSEITVRNSIEIAVRNSLRSSFAARAELRTLGSLWFKEGPIDLRTRTRIDDLLGVIVGTFLSETQ